jgi:hypothetical protein
VRCTARGDEMSHYQKSVTPFFAMHSDKSTSFGGFEQNATAMKRKSGRFCQF